MCLPVFFDRSLNLFAVFEIIGSCVFGYCTRSTTHTETRVSLDRFPTLDTGRFGLRLNVRQIKRLVVVDAKLSGIGAFQASRNGTWLGIFRHPATLSQNVVNVKI